MKSLVKNIISKTKTFFRYDLSRSVTFELLFILLVAFLLYAHNIGMFGIDIHFYIIILFLLWAVLAMFGFFIPIIRESWVIGITGSREPGIPLCLEIEARGGFIAGRKIRLKANILKLGNNRDSQKEFKDIYESFSLVFFSSVSIPLKEGSMLEGHPEAGGVSLTPDKYKANEIIIFNSPGAYIPHALFKKKNDPKSYGGPLSETPINQKLVISPAESWVGLRNYAITYALALIILLLTLVQLGLL